jgi:hypothetical protein
MPRASFAFGMLGALVTSLCTALVPRPIDHEQEQGRPRVDSSVTNPAGDDQPIAWFPRGAETLGLDYYVDSAMALGIPRGQYASPDVAYASWTVDDLLDYMGFAGLAITPTPCQVMAAAEPDEILAMRYFAPKTSSVDNEGHASELGWRQIVRLSARSGSAAANAGVASAYVLLNFQQIVADVATDPFAHPPIYTQVMLVSTDPVRRPTRWLVFDEQRKRVTGIKATFAGGDVATSGQTLHLPDACAQCHGGDKRLPHLNLFDVDNWVDRASVADTFGLVGTRSRISVTSVGVCDIKPIDVARALNREIQAHNDLPGLRTPKFVREAVASWNLKHASADYVSMAARSFGPTRWAPGSTSDLELLGMLNRYCYRCHGTIRFDVFNRSQVVGMARRAIRQIDLGLMPLDRQGDRLIPSADRRRIVELLAGLR